MRRSTGLPGGGAASYIPPAMRMKNERELRAMLREAERELDAATRKSEVNAAAVKLMHAKTELKRLEQQATAG